MKKKKLFSTVLAILILLSLPTRALAVQWEGFTDVQDHWAAETLKKAFADGLVTGMNDTELSPDSPITAAQMITILTRVLGATEKADVSGLNLPADAWYAEAAAKALHLGLISTQTGNLDAPMIRQDALAMMSGAFGLVSPAPEGAYLVDSYSDAALVRAANRAPLEGLLSRKLVEGFAGSLNANGNITRAEFVTVLYRTVQNYMSPNETLPSEGGVMVKGSLSLSNITLKNTLWLDCSAQSASFFNVTAPSSEVIIRAHKLSSLFVQGSSDIGQLTIDSGSYDLSFAPAGDAKIGALTLGGHGSAKLSGKNIQDVHVTGTGSTASLDGTYEHLFLTGSGNTVTLSPGTTIRTIFVSGEGNTLLQAAGSESAALPMRIALSGSRNSIAFTAKGEGQTSFSVQGSGHKLTAELLAIDTLNVSSAGAALELTARGEINRVEVSGSENNLKLQAALAIGDNPSTDFGGKLNDVSLISDTAISAPSSGEAGSLSLQAPAIKSLPITGAYVSLRVKDGSKAEAISLGGTGNALTTEQGAEFNSLQLAGTGNVLVADGSVGSIEITGPKARISGAGRAKSITINAYGTDVTLAADSLVDNKGNISPEEVLKLVTTGYKGNFTLEWAQENDYEDYVKEAWINARGHSSKTDYLIWISLSMQRVNIFKGSAGGWELFRESIVGSGAPRSPTPVGVWTTTYKQAAGWTTSSYTCKPVVGFRQGTGYAFHSRLYYPNSSKLKDPGIGYPISAGCIRMYDEDIQYIFDNIPNGTTVVVY